MDTKFRMLSNGKLVAPPRGEPPPPPVGYRMSNVPFVYEPIVDDCVSRNIKVVSNTHCGCTRAAVFCMLDSKEVTMGDCHACLHNPNPNG